MKADLVSRPVAELQDMLRDRMMSTTGSKDVLIDRLMQAVSLRTSVPEPLTPEHVDRGTYG